MSISFGGLATGLDTNAIVDQLMALERRPIERMAQDKTWLNARLAAFTAFDTNLSGFLASIENLGSSEDLRQKQVTAANEDFFSVSAEVDALPGTSYQVEVQSLAQVEKEVSQGYADKNSQNFGAGELVLTVGENDPVTINVDGENNSLEGIMQAINDADAGVSASIINDGTSSPYRLILTGDDVATPFTLNSTLPDFNGDVTSLTVGGYLDQTAKLFGEGTIELSTGQIALGGPDNSLEDIRDTINAAGHPGVSAAIVDDGNGGFRLDITGATISSTDLSGGTGYNNLSLSETQTATQAHIRVDNIDIYSDSNTLSEAIPGISLDLLKAEVGTTTAVDVKLDEAAIKSQIQSFVGGYNSVVGYISGQSTMGDTAGGILGGDSGLNAVKRRLQNMLTAVIDNSGTFRSLSQLGLETQKNGTLKLDDETLTSAIQNDLDSVEKLLVGENGAEGIAVTFQNYLEDLTDSNDGILAGRQESIDANIKQLDSRIEQTELRLTHKEETLRAKYIALEQLVSGMNSQSAFLTQQMDMLNNMMTRNN